MERLCISLCFFISISAFASQYSLDEALSELDKAVVENAIYSRQREDRVAELKYKLHDGSDNSVYHYDLNMALYNEYRAYVCDSATHYLNKCIKIAQALQDQDREYESKLKQAFLMASAGMYLESVETLSEINRNELPEHLIRYYMETNLRVYGELSHYTQNREIAQRYGDYAGNYRDSLLSILPAGDDLKMSLQESYHLYTNDFVEARRINDVRMAKVKLGTSEYAMVAWCRSLIYQREGDVENQKYYLALSALSDIQSATKDHASLWTLAQLLYKENDIKRAYDYIRFSWSETVFFNARLRSLQSAVILSLIDKTYQATIERQKSTLQDYLILISVLSGLLVLALIYIYGQMKRLSIARKNLQATNSQLRELNEELNVVNIKLQSTNLDLSESNQIKEVYIGKFLKLCSTYIDKLDEFRRMVNKKIVNDKIPELLNYTKPQDTLDDVFQELYINFDDAFLRIFPDFVDRVNELFYEDQQIILKKDGVLNTELRILALVRLGISDSSQIADFLRYSVITIYNNRTKLRNRAISRDDFEANIMLIK